jgi:hypothetical protein
MCFSIDIKGTPRLIIVKELDYIIICKYCEKNVYKKVYVCPYCTCKIGHPECIIPLDIYKCPICEEEFALEKE